MDRSLFVLALVFGLGSLYVSPSSAQPSSACEALPALTNCKLLDDFEADTAGEPPHKWRTDKRRKKLIPLTDPEAMDSKENVYVRREDGNQFARVFTDAHAFRVVLSHEYGLDWHLGKRSYLRWSWRAKALPEGANERRTGRNDTGGAVYVTFGTDWLGRPKSIKYTYSSSLPVGTTVDFGPLQVLVVASKTEQGLNRWITHERNVVEDYERLFGEPPPKTPLAIMMWSDSNSVNSVGTVDFDDLLLLSQPARSDTATASSQ